ncbi:nickel pincer cofactor biosynthesis protein LarB [uncultured Acidaminococcus sp.]|jgi:NCAIR mutase (PurE)-related protein|uniref:nickel pincer cofactor biosynthesis protein LarB n=1 Tax=uncultured Acidaminococcus sp. TaxID=352152 RepID=UPI00265FEA3D|nr:nickel pincer cofactor biosynthesis protein LarB [uncultured Acidaminococcus sp.]
METKEILEKVRSGEISVDTAEKFFRQKPFEDLGFAKLDTHREIRTGFGEVVFCSGKRDAHLKQIFQKLAEKEGNVLGTRASREQFELIRTLCPDAVYDPLARLVKVIRKPVELRGSVAVCTAGTADIPVAEEAAQTAEFFGSKVNRVYDVGVSGLHRLLASLDPIQEANCVIAVAGMEGALPSVLGGLVSNPVIAVPTSIGYGASLQGISALLTMLNSCANGIAVVNIDNGYGAGYMATQINRLALGKDEEHHG